MTWLAPHGYDLRLPNRIGGLFGSPAPTAYRSQLFLFFGIPLMAMGPVLLGFGGVLGGVAFGVGTGFLSGLQRFGHSGFHVTFSLSPL